MWYVNRILPAALMGSLFTSIVRNAGDLSACVLDRRSRLVAQAVTGLPERTNSIATGIQHIVTTLPVDTLEPQDVIIINDPWITVSQLHDIAIATPMLHERRVVAHFARWGHDTKVIIMYRS